MTSGYIRVAAAIPQVKVADCHYNTEQVESYMAKAEGMGVEVVCFPELCITGYTCQDLFQQQLLLDEAEASLLRLLELSRNLKVTAIVGLPLSYGGVLLNCAAVIGGGKVHGLVPKTFIPNYKEFYEKRWFSPSNIVPEGATYKFCGQNVPIGPRLLFDNGTYTFGIEICEDLWATIPPSSMLTVAGAEMVFNLSASNELVGKSEYLRSLVGSQSARCLAGYVYAGCGFGESTQDLVFGGRAYIAENGRLLKEAERFSLEGQIIAADMDVELLRAERRANTSFAGSKLMHNCCQFRTIEMPVPSTPRMGFAGGLERRTDPQPFVPAGEELDRRCEEILCIQSEGLAQRVNHTKAKKVVVGVSGGLDSTLALLVCVHAFDRLGRDRRDIVGVTMPGFGTTSRTHSNADELMRGLGITSMEIDITQASKQHLHDIGHSLDEKDTTYENAQARERTQVIMDVANQMGGFVVGTGDLSELALGWATYNGDHMSMYGVNTSIPKTLVKHLVKWVADNVADEKSRETLLDIVDTPISPELIPAASDGTILQKTEDLVGPYELHDFFLYYTLRYGFHPTKIFNLALAAFNGSDPRVEQYDGATIKKWLTTFVRRFFSQQFKRSCLPDGPKVGSCSLSPRGDWRMASDASAADWISECESINI